MIESREIVDALIKEDKIQAIDGKLAIYSSATNEERHAMVIELEYLKDLLIPSNEEETNYIGMDGAIYGSSQLDEWLEEIENHVRKNIIGN